MARAIPLALTLDSARCQEKNRFLATDIKERDYKQELITLNDIVLEETQAFFRKILDTEAVPIESPEIKEPKR